MFYFSFIVQPRTIKVICSLFFNFNISLIDPYCCLDFFFLRNKRRAMRNETNFGDIFRCSPCKLLTLEARSIRICWRKGLCFRNAFSQVTLPHNMKATNGLRGT